MSAINAVVKRILSSNRLSFIITFVVVLCAVSSKDSSVALSNGNYFWLASLFIPFFSVLYAVPRLLHLGAEKRDCYIGSLCSYCVIALVVSLLNTFVCLFIDPINKSQTVINLMNVCRWMENGVIIAFLQQAVFLLLLMLFIHVMIELQHFWLGWLIDILLVAGLSVSMPIAPLRSMVASFFSIIMVNDNAIIQISSCLILSVLFAFISLVLIKRKAF